jgi:hypothetical protein
LNPTFLAQRLRILFEKVNSLAEES